jgi:hypothetical protein
MRVAAGIVLVLAACVGYALFRPSGTFPPLPVPNGYDDLVRAGKEATGDPPRSSPANNIDVATLKAFVDANKEPLDRGRLGLSRECGVPVAFSREALEAHLAQGGTIRRFGRLLDAEGKLAEKEGRTKDAADSYLALHRLGQCAARNGLMVDYSLRLAFESMGSKGVSGLRTKLDQEGDRGVIQTLREIDREWETVDRVVAREREWYRRSAPAYERFIMWSSGAGDRLLAPAIMGLEKSSTLNQAFVRLLIADLAIRAFHQERAVYPDRLANLVPAELPTVPVDPFSGRPLVYRETKSGYVLYSVGPDGRDDGGAPMADAKIWWEATGDLQLTPP